MKVLEPYNQYLHTETKSACVIVSLAHIFKFRYAIFIYMDFLLKAAIYLDKMQVFSILEGASFSVLDKFAVWDINRKLGLDFKLEVRSISGLDKTDLRTYQFGIKSYSTYKFNKAIEIGNGGLTKKSIDYLATLNGGVGHAVAFDMSVGGRFIDSNGTFSVPMTLEVLKYGVEKGLFRDTCRTVSPNDDETKEVVKLTVQMFQAEKKGHLELFYNKYSENPYLEKAKKIYWYGR